MSSKFKYFVLLANMRTGSNLFEQNIRLYPELSCHGELFNPHFIGYPGEFDKCGISMQEREVKPQKLLKKLISQEKDTLPGFRLFADHDPRILQKCLSDHECAKIVLTRNPLDSYVSQAIAQVTNQWKLTDISKRKKAKIEFDIIAFRSYLKKIQTFLSDIKTGLQRSGQTAFYLGYDDLNDVSVYNGLVSYLCNAEPRKELAPDIVRQNPEALKDKVVNYDTMVQQVGQIDLLALEAVPLLEPVRNPGSKNFKGGSSLPVLFLPMHRSEFPELDIWLKTHEKNLSGKENISLDMNQKQLAAWLGKHSNRQVISIVSHPVERAYNAFYRHIFCSGDNLFPWIRTTLEKHYDMRLPAKQLSEHPNRSVLENSGYSLMDHRKAFEVFLQFVKGNLQGLTRARVDQSWASQNSIIQGYCRLVIPSEVIRAEHLQDTLRRAEQALGLEHVPLTPVETSNHCFTLAEIYAPEIEEAARNAYARDYQMFGFGNWA